MDDETANAPLSVTESQAVCEAVLEALSEAVIATDEFLESVLTAVVADQHLLLEDVPGTGKTLTARSLATALGLEFNRVQFTPDLLPADITGSEVFDDASGTFRFNRGPIFANVVVADEINRAPAKTQAALLEVMEEGQVSVGDTTHEVPTPFLVIATQNPIEQEGTFALPEAQRDRFMIKTNIGYPAREEENRLLSRRLERTSGTPSVEQVTDVETLTDIQQAPESVHVDPTIREYVLDLGRETRDHAAAEVGVSPRGIQRLLEATRARATIRGREYVVPDDVQQLAPDVFAHRIVLNSTAMVEGTDRADVIADAVESVPVPAMSDEA